MPKGKHLRVTMYGVMGTKAAPFETWQTGVNVDVDMAQVPWTQAELLTRATAIYDSFVSTIGARLQGPLVFLGCDLREIGADGKQPRAADGSFVNAVRYEPVTPSTVVGPPKYPFQVSVVASLRTARSGPEGKGRMFLPAPIAVVDVDGRLTTAVADQIATSTAAWVSHVNTHFARNVSVMSTKGFASTVTGVRVGRVLDTHRSRRRDQAEAPSNVVPVTT